MSESVLLVCHAGSALGIGHLSRMLALAEALGDVEGIELLIQGERLQRTDLDAVPHRFIPLEDPLTDAISRAVAGGAQRVVLDLHPKLLPEQFDEVAAGWKASGATLIGVDTLLPLCRALDVMWVPSLLVPTDATIGCEKLEFGWDSFLIRPPVERVSRESGPRRVLVLTGGSDTTDQAHTLPALVDSALPDESEVWWVQGPFSEAPSIPRDARLSWTIHKGPAGLGPIIAEVDLALTVFGVTLFELIQSGVPTVVFSPYADREVPELEVVAAEQAAIVAETAPEAVMEVAELASDEALAAELGMAARSRMAVNGSERLARLIHSLSE